MGHDFFLDSGIVYGQLGDFDDVYRDASLKHLHDYPYRDHNYYAVKRVALREVESIRNGKRTRPGSNKPLGVRRLEMQRLLAQTKTLFISKIKDVDYHLTYTSFWELYKIVHRFLETNKKEGDYKPKTNDAEILTNAFIWDKENLELNSPRFVTIDKGDIIDNKDSLKSISNEFLKTRSRLGFCLILRTQSS